MHCGSIVRSGGKSVRRYLALHLTPSSFTTAAFNFLQTNSYPTARIETGWGVPVEISLIAQLSHGEGTALYTNATHRQRAHELFVDELDEPSSKIGATRLDLFDKTALYTFSVGAGGHPFHRHQGHRVVVGVSGSGGADLRFSSATPEEVKVRSATFVEKMHVIRVPADCIFTMRFDGRVWHQFSPTPCPLGTFTPINPAFFAMSVHTDETQGEFDDPTRALIEQNRASIASLTELLPPQCLAEVDIPNALASGSVPITKLSLAHSASQEEFCRLARGSVGGLRRVLGAAIRPALTGAGFALTATSGEQRSGSHLVVNELSSVAVVPDWLVEVITETLPGAHHTDIFEMKLPLLNDYLNKLSPRPLTASDSSATAAASAAGASGASGASGAGAGGETASVSAGTAGASAGGGTASGGGSGTGGGGDIALARLLEGFIEHPPPSVSRLQSLRNNIVRPMGLRTSPLGCPVSSLLRESDCLFAGKYPVHKVHRRGDEFGSSAVAVVLGVDDVHLRFRTIVGVDTITATVYMCTRVETLNSFGSFYYTMIDWAHRKFITPRLMRYAAAYATASLEMESCGATVPASVCTK